MKDYAVIVYEGKSHGRHGKDAIIGLNIEAPTKAAAIEEAKAWIAEHTWEEVLQNVNWTEIKKQRFADAWMSSHIGQLYAERKFSYKAYLAKEKTI